MSSKETISRDRSHYDVWTKVPLRYSDQDPMQHINNVAITALLESGRTGLLNDLFRKTPLPTRGMVLARLTVDYLHEITFPGAVDIGGRLAAIGSRSMTTQYALYQGDVCCVTSESVNVFFDPETRKSTEPSKDIAATLRRRLGR